MSRTHRHGGHLFVRAAAPLALVAGFLSLAAPVSAATTTPHRAPATRVAPVLTLSGGAATVKAANGTKFFLTPTVIYDEVPSLGVNLARIVGSGKTAGVEEHLWSLPMTASDLTFSSSSRTGKLDTGTEDEPVASVDLTFTATSAKSGSCESGSETIYTGTLKGSITLVTGLSGGGTIKAHGVTFDADGYTSELTSDDGCVASLGDLCKSALIFGVIGHVDVSGGDITYVGSSPDEVGLEKRIVLSSPAGASELSLVSEGSPAPVWNPSTGVLSISTGGGIVKGSATLTGGKKTTASFPCSYGGTSYTMSLVSYQKAKYSSPAGKVITGHEAIGGKLSGPKTSKKAYFEITTAKAG